MRPSDTVGRFRGETSYIQKKKPEFCQTCVHIGAKFVLTRIWTVSHSEDPVGILIITVLLADFGLL